MTYLSKSSIRGNQRTVCPFVTLKSGEALSGVVVNLNGDRVTRHRSLQPEPKNQCSAKGNQSMGPSPVSPMPPGLLNMMEKDEIMDLLAYILSGGDPEHDFQKLKLHEPGSLAFFFVFGTAALLSQSLSFRNRMAFTSQRSDRSSTAFGFVGLLSKTGGGWEFLGFGIKRSFGLRIERSRVSNSSNGGREIRIALNPEPEQDRFAVMARNEFTTGVPGIPIYTHHSTGTAGLAVWGHSIPPSG